MRNTSQPFRPRARLLLELGNELIKNESIALFELVKNSYDADATNSTIKFSNIDQIEKGVISIIDDGSGMDWDTVTKVWLEPGTNFREKQLTENLRTPLFHRLPLGQKGIGRFGAHKLGKKIELITRKKGKNEIRVVIDWGEFEKDDYLENISVKVSERTPEIFKGNKTGTSIKIQGIWKSWTKEMVKEVYRSVNSICSPFKKNDSFKVTFDLQDNDKKSWIRGLLNWEEIFKYKLFKAHCEIVGDELSYTYEFLPWKSLSQVKGRKVIEKKVKISDRDGKKIDLSKYEIGKINLELNIFDLDTNILSLGVSDVKGLREFLSFNGGIRVYRDDMRVYDYGEQGNDWLNLDMGRVNAPSVKISNNLVLGYVGLDAKESKGLKEKTNREGFIETEETLAFRKAIIFTIAQIEAQRKVDKNRIRIAYTKSSQKEPVLSDIDDLRKKLKSKGLEKELGGYINRIERDFKEIKERLIVGASAGLSLSIVIHEVEKIIDELGHVIKKEKSTSKIRSLVEHLAETVEGYASLIKTGSDSKIKVLDLIKQSIFNVNYRLNAHKIDLRLDISEKQNFYLKVTKRLILGSIMNIIDNSIWWLENKNPLEKRIYITTRQLPEGNAIIIADNGPGFSDPLEYLIQPFFTKKPDGMGLGLNIVSEIMKSHKGQIKILRKGEVEMPKGIDGAILALIFKEQRE